MGEHTHAKYTDAEAKAAAVRAGAITDGETKAPTHDAVYDVKATAEAAIAKALLTTQGDIIVRGAAVPGRFAKPATGKYLRATATGYEGATVVAGKSIATGSYAGDSTDGRQITVGFKCSLVIIIGLDYAVRGVMIPNATITDTNGVDNRDDTSSEYLHATDGFVVAYGGAGNVPLNVSGRTYYYWAISE